MAYVGETWVPERGYIPVDLAVELAGFKQSDLYDFGNGNYSMPAPDPSGDGWLTTNQMAIKRPGALLVVELPKRSHDMSPEQIAEVIKQAIASYQETQ